MTSKKSSEHKPGKGHGLAPVATALLESAGGTRGGGSGETSTEPSVDSDAPPSGDSGETDHFSTRSDSDGAGVVHVPGGSSCETSLMQSLAQLVKSHTDMVAAQTRGMSAQTLPRMPHSF